MAANWSRHVLQRWANAEAANSRRLPRADTPKTVAPPLSRLAFLLLACAAFLWILSTAASVLIAVLMALIFSTVLRPLVDRLERMKMPRPLAVLAVLGLTVGLGSTAIISLQTPAVEVINQLPEAVRKVRISLQHEIDQQSSVMHAMRKTSKELDRFSDSSALTQAAASETTFVPSKWLRDQLISTGNSVINKLTYALLMLMLIGVLLNGGEPARLRLVRALSPQLEERLRWLRILSDVSKQLRTYVLINVIANVVLTVVTWLVLALLGVEQAWFWGIAAGLLHFIPFLGPLILAAALGATLILQGGSAMWALTAALATIASAFVVGVLVMTWLQSRAGKIDTAMLLIAMLLLGALWGLWGLMLAGPVLAIIKSFATHTEGADLARALLEKSE